MINGKTELSEVLKKDGALRTIEAEIEWCGVYWMIRHIPKAQFVKMQEQCNRVVYVRHQRTEQTDQQKFGRSLINAGLIGWRGLTPEKLLELIPAEKKQFQDVGIDMDAEEIPFRKDLAYAFDENTYGWGQFLLDTVLDYQVLEAANKEALRKNSKASPGSGSEPVKTPAKSAKKPYVMD